MKKILKTVSAFLVALSMAALPVTAQDNGGRQSHFSSGQSNSSSANKPRPSGGNNNGGSNQGTRPGGHSGSSTRPGGNGNSGSRPGGNNGGGNNRPGGNSGSRPNTGGSNGHRPGGNSGQRPGGTPTPGRPSPPPPSRPSRPSNFGGGPHTHHVPFFGHYNRPTPPPSWRPVAYGPSFSTILGISFGTSVNLTINALLNSGYNVTSYGNDVVYLTNVPQMNYYWPDAVLYYNNGALCGSSFTYPTTFYDMSRYNALYNTFCGQYGVPVYSVNQGGVISSTWFGSDNRYVTLEFNSNYGNYYTTLSFGI